MFITAEYVLQARALRLEREKAAAKRKSNTQQVRLSYDANEKSFVLGGGQDEIQQILTDLCKVSQIKGLSTATGGSNDDLNGGLSHDNNSHPTPSPQPLHPSINMSANVGHSYGMQTQNASDFIDLNGMLATPG